MREFECCICHKVVREWGNDPFPINKEDGAQCCDRCNIEKVVPARLALVKKGETKNGQR